MLRILFCVLATMFLLEGSAFTQESTNAATSKPAGPVAEVFDTKGKEAKEARLKARVLIDQARVDLENGRFEEAEKKLRGALALGPSQRASSYYLTLIEERRAARQNASVHPIYPVIRNYEGTLQYGMPVHKRAMREVADDVKGK